MKIKKIDGKSRNPQKELGELLKKNFPEIFTEQKIDCQKLKRTLGEDVEANGERYGLSWAGKGDCFRHIQEPTTKTLKPAKGESVDFENTGNLFIEGENLEVLKVLQKSYYGKVKAIYIDPPYNTGNDSFIYPDRFQESQDEYLRRIGDKDEEGNLTKEGMFRKNSKDGGHYHSNWLSMMYPRLFLARNLLRQDGVIFVSIDDNEVHNLRMIMNEIFGEDNFEGHIHWRRRHNQPNDPTKLIAVVAEHILIYSRNTAVLKSAGVGKLELTGKFSNPDNDPRGEWNSKPWKVGSNQSGTKYPIALPDGQIVEGEWMGEERTYKELLKDNRIYFPKDGKGLPRKKIFKFEREMAGQSATNWFENGNFGSNQDASAELAELFEGNKNLFDNPKPIMLLQSLIRLGNAKNNEIVLDFFAGAGTTGHAVMAQNAEDGGNRKFICVQMPELCDEESEAYKAGYKTIADIAKERIRRAGKKIEDEVSEKRGHLNGLREVYGYKKGEIKEVQSDMDVPAYDFDLGFKVFKLDDSNFKVWNGNVKDAEELEKQMLEFVDNVKKESTEENMLWELLLKSGLDPNVAVEMKKSAGENYYSIDGGKLIVYLGKKLSKEFVDSIVQAKPEKMICLDRAFAGNDQLKTNTALSMESAKIDFRVV